MLRWTSSGGEPEKWKPETRETADHSLPVHYRYRVDRRRKSPTNNSPVERFADREVWKFWEKREKFVRHNELSGMYPEAVANIVSCRSWRRETADEARRLSNGTREKIR